MTDDQEYIDLFAPWDGRRVPVTLLGGYLGAGKTSVINEMLATSDRPIAVLVNDVGEVNIDASLIQRQHGDTIELTDGCVCCSLAGGLVAAFESLRQREAPPDHVIVELSGVADPNRVIRWSTSPGFVLDGVVVLVDVDQFVDRFEDAATSELIKMQVQAADLLVLTKLDLVTEAKLQYCRNLLESFVTNVPTLASNELVATASFLGLATRRPGGATDFGEPKLFDAHEVSLREVPNPISASDFEALIAALPASTLRAKGVAIAPDGTRLLAQVVGRRRSVTILPDAETQPATNLVVISPPPIPRTFNGA